LPEGSGRNWEVSVTQAADSGRVGVSRRRSKKAEEGEQDAAEYRVVSKVILEANEQLRLAAVEAFRQAGGPLSIRKLRDHTGWGKAKADRVISHLREAGVVRVTEAKCGGAKGWTTYELVSQGVD
jgi:hypothetical protein